MVDADLDAREIDGNEQEHRRTHSLPVVIRGPRKENRRRENFQRQGNQRGGSSLRSLECRFGCISELVPMAGGGLRLPGTAGRRGTADRVSREAETRYYFMAHPGASA